MRAHALYRVLFATDIRMTILVTLALASGPMRQKNLLNHIGKSAKTALYPLVERGLVFDVAAQRFEGLRRSGPVPPGGRTAAPLVAAYRRGLPWLHRTAARGG